MINEPSDIRKKARKKARAKARFYTHLAIYLLVNAVVLIIFLPKGRPGLVLSFLSLFVWGYVLYGDYREAFGKEGFSFFGDDWLEKETDREMKKMEEDLELPDLEKKEKRYDESDLV